MLRYTLPGRYCDSDKLMDFAWTLLGQVPHGLPRVQAICDLEAYLGQEWLTFDARYNVSRIGRVKVAHGADAVDGVFATIYGEGTLHRFEVWAYQVNPLQVSVGHPIDLSKRLDGSEAVRMV